MKYTDAQLTDLKARVLFAQSNGIQLAHAVDHLGVVLDEVLEHRAAACCQEEPVKAPKVEAVKVEKKEEPKPVKVPEAPPAAVIPPADVPAPLEPVVPPAPSTSPVLEDEEPKKEDEKKEAPKAHGKKK